MKYFFIKANLNHPLWDDYISWLNKTYNRGYLGKDEALFYGFDGVKCCYRDLTKAKNNVRIISLEVWWNIFVLTQAPQDNLFKNHQNLYLERTITFDSPEEMLYKFVGELTSSRTTCTGLATYTANGDVQTTRGKMRSFDDIYCVAKAYFPSITIEEVLIILLRLKPNLPTIDSYTAFPQLHHCSTMDRIRFIYIQGTRLNNYLNTSKLSSAYSWKTLLNKININSYEEFEKFLKYSDKIIVGDKSTYIYKRSNEVAVQTPTPIIQTKIKQKPKTVSGLKVTFEYNKVTIGETVFSKTDIIGIKKRFSPFRFNSKQFPIKGSIEIEGKIITYKQIENISNFLN